MSIDYTIVDGPGGPDGKGAWMTHEDRRMPYETTCDGCGEAYKPYSRIVTIITDRSGSEQATAHGDKVGCVKAAIATL